MSRFEAIGHFVYENGNRIGCIPDEAAIELARKLNAYQMRVERFKSENARLKAEVERLTSDIQMEKENEDRLVREWQKANNEVYGLQTQVAALIDDQTRLNAEVERLRKGDERDLTTAYLYAAEQSKDTIARLKAEVERLTNELEKQDLLLAMANAFVTDWNAAKNGNFNETKSPGFIEDLGNGVEKHDLKFRVPPVVKNGGQP